MSANPTPRPYDCAKCGEEHTRCLAHQRGSGKPCRGQPLDGQDVCRVHGGRQPAALEKATVRIEELRARSILERLERPAPIEHPVLELLAVAGETREWQRILRERLDELGSLYVTDTFRVERERAVVVLYERALDRSGRLLVDLAKLDLQARALKLNQQTAAQVMQAVVEALKRTGLAEHEPAVRRELAAIFAEMA